MIPVDKTRNVIAIFLALIFLGEMLSAIGFVGIALILIGTMLMIENKTKLMAGLKGFDRAHWHILKFFLCSYFSNYPNYSNCQIVFRT